MHVEILVNNQASAKPYVCFTLDQFTVFGNSLAKPALKLVTDHS
jgi:hypothetical protein